MQIFSKKKYNVLVLGKTGAGKTTAINMFLNMAKSLKYKDPRLVGITQVFKFQDQKPIELSCNIDEFREKQSDFKLNQSESQTKDANM
jgi:septin family protein